MGMHVKRKYTPIKCSNPPSWLQDRPPVEQSISIGSEERAQLKQGQGKFKNRNFEQKRKLWIGKGGGFEEEQEIVQNETREYLDIQNKREKVQIGVEYSIPLPWPQDRPPDEKILRKSMREEDMLRESSAFKNRRNRTQSGVEHSIPLPWPQDRPPDEKFQRGLMTEEDETRKRCSYKNENDRAKLGADYRFPPPWSQEEDEMEEKMQDRPPNKQKLSMLESTEQRKVFSTLSPQYLFPPNFSIYKSRTENTMHILISPTPKEPPLDIRLVKAQRRNRKFPRVVTQWSIISRLYFLSFSQRQPFIYFVV